MKGLTDTPAEQIRRLVISHREDVKGLLLSPLQVHVVSLDRMRVEGVTSAWLSTYLRQPTNTTSTYLMRLYKRGYLTRERFDDPTGGYHYLYRNAL